jgi:hypothetical protein
MAKKEVKNKPINLNQTKFAQHYAENGNATMAYLFAYPNVTYDSARELGSNLLAREDVKLLIEQYKEELSIKFSVTKEKMMKELIEVAEEARQAGNLNAFSKMKEMIIKMCGFYAPEKIEHSGNQPITVIKITEVRKDEE